MASGTRSTATRRYAPRSASQARPRAPRQSVELRDHAVLPTGRAAAVPLRNRASIPLSATIAVARARTCENPEVVHHWHDLAEKLYHNQDFEGATLAYKRVQQLYSAQTVVRAPPTPTPPTPLEKAVLRSRPTATELAASTVGREKVPEAPPTGAAMKLTASKPPADEILRRLLHQDLEHVMGLLDRKASKDRKKVEAPDYPVA